LNHQEKEMNEKKQKIMDESEETGNNL